MKKLLSAFLIFAALQSSLAQTLSPTIVKSNSINYERLAQIDSLLKKYEDQNWLIGDVVIILF